MPVERPIHDGWRLRFALLCLLAPSLSVSQEKLERSVVYAFGGSGAFLRIAIAPTLTATTGSLPAVEGNRGAFPPASPGPSHKSDTYWLGTGYLYDPALRRIYGVFPAAKADAPDPVSLVSMRVPEMKVEAAIPLAEGPALLLSPGGERLFVSGMRELPAPRDGSMQIFTTVYGASDLKPVKKYEQVVDRERYMMAAVENHAGFQSGAYLSRDGSVIYDRMSTLRATGDSFQRHDVDVLGLLTSGEREGLRAFESVDAASGRTYLPIAFESSSAGVLVLRVVNARKSDEALIVVDIAAEKVLRILRVSLCRATLTPDGKTILVEGLRPAAAAAGQPPSRALLKTGVITAYDTRSGERLKSYEAKDLAGDEENHQIKCFDPGSRSFIYEAAAQLYLVRTSFDDKPVRINSSFIAGPETACVYADM